MEILPLLAEALDTGVKQPAPPMKKMKRPFIKKEGPSYKRYICSGCGYEYDMEIGDPASDVPAGTTFDKLPEEWICPECGEEKKTSSRLNRRKKTYVLCKKSCR